MGPSTTGGSMNELSWRCQPCRINDLGLVAQAVIEPLRAKSVSSPRITREMSLAFMEVPRRERLGLIARCGRRDADNET